MGGRIELSTELAWEMTRKALQEHKLQRTPIKLVVGVLACVYVCVDMKVYMYILLLEISTCIVLVYIIIDHVFDKSNRYSIAFHIMYMDKSLNICSCKAYI